MKRPFFRTIGTILVTLLTSFGAKADFQGQTFPHLQKQLGERAPQYETFLKTIAEHFEAFSKLDQPQSEAEIVNLSFAKNEMSNSYDREAKTLFMGKDSCTTGAKDIDYLAVQIHEYAHSIFAPNFTSRFRASIMATAQNHKEYFRRVLKYHGLPDEKKPAEVIADTSTLSMPFDEFFADAAAVLILNDPQALSGFFEKCSDLQNMRDFSFDYPLEQWNVGKLGGLFDRRHEVLNPTRSFVWKYYSAHREQKDIVPRIIGAIFDASSQIIHELEERQVTFEQYALIDQAELNRKMIAALTSRL